MKVWSLVMSVREYAYEAKSGRYEPHSCTHAFAREIYDKNLVGKSTKQTFMSRIDPRISNSLCSHVPSQRGYLLHPVSSFFFSTRSSLKFQKRKLTQFRISRFKRHGRVQLPHGKRLFDVVCRCHRVLSFDRYRHCMALPGNFRHGSDECYVVCGLIVFICFLLLIMLIGAFNSRCLESRGA